MEGETLEQVHARHRRKTVKRVWLWILGFVVVAGLLTLAVLQYYQDCTSC